MQIESLSTENFKKLGTQFFEFTSGVNFISGENGAGKSTLLRAIAASLFGVQMLPGHSDHVATFGQKTWKLSLAFKHKGESYRLDRSKSTASICKGGELVANGNTPVTKYIEDLLGMAAKDFNLLIHSRQGETNYVLNYGGTALQRKIEEFSGVEVVEKVASLAAGLGRDLSLQVDAVQGFLLTTEALEELRDASEVAGLSVKELTAVLESLEMLEKPEAPENQIASAVKQRNDYLNSLKALEQYVEAKQQIEEDLTALEAVEQPLEPIEVQEKLKAARQDLKEIQDLTALIQRKQARKDALQAQLRDEQEPDLPKAEIAEKLLQLKELKRDQFDKVSEATAEVKHLRSHLKDATCSACGSELKEVNEEEVNQRIKKLLNDIEFAKVAISNIDEQEYDLSADLKQWDAVEAQEDLHQQWSSVEVPTLNEGVSLEDTQELIAQLRSELAGYEDKLSAYESYLSRKKRLEGRLEALKEPVVLPEVGQEAVEEVEKQWQQYQEQLSAYQSRALQAENLQKDLEREKEKAATAEKTIQDNTEKVARSAELAGEAETAKDLNKYLRDRRGEYLTQVWDGIMFHAGEFLRKSTKGWLEDVCIEDGKFLYKEEGAWIPTVELSGAQESFVGTSLRVGISKSLHRNDMFLIFDEPTDGMKEENARNLIAELAGTAGQVFIITHKETDQALADNLVEIV